MSGKKCAGDNFGMLVTDFSRQHIDSVTNTFCCQHHPTTPTNTVAVSGLSDINYKYITLPFEYSSVIRGGENAESPHNSRKQSVLHSNQSFTEVKYFKFLKRSSRYMKFDIFFLPTELIIGVLKIALSLQSGFK